MKKFNAFIHIVEIFMSGYSAILCLMSDMDKAILAMCTAIFAHLLRVED